MKTLEDKIAALDAAHNSLLEQMAPMQRKLTKVYNRYKTLTERLANDKYGSLTAEIPLTSSQWIDLLDIFPETTAKYKARQRVLSRFGGGYGGITSSGYYPDTNQVSLQISFTKGNAEQLQVVYNGLQQLLPYLKPLKDGYIHIRVFEHTLSESGSYSLLIRGEKITMNKRVYSVDQEVKSWDNLRTALAYVQEHYYSDGVDNEEEGD